MKSVVTEKSRTADGSRNPSNHQGDARLQDEIFVVIPAFNESRTIRVLVEKLLQYVSNVIVVDDGSSDNTADLIEDLPVVVIRNQENQGKAITLLTGMKEALQRGASAVISIDGDGQHDPADIPRFVERFKTNPHTIVIGSRLHNKDDIPPARYFGNTVANFWISWAAGYVIADSQSGFRLYPGKLLEQLNTHVHRNRGFVFESEILIDAAKVGFQSTTVPIAAIYRPDARPSHFRGFSDVMKIIRMVAIKLLSSGMKPMGLFRLMKHKLSNRKKSMVGADGFFTFFITILLFVLSGGILYAINFINVFLTARNSPPSVNAEDGMIIVPGVRLDNGKIVSDYKARLDRTYTLARKYPNSGIIILGGYTSSNRISEAEAGKHYLMDKGIADERILREDGSRHTLENFQNARKIIKSNQHKRQFLVTNRYHLERSSVFARSFGVEHQLCAAEEKLRLTPGMILTIAKESFLLYWFHTGKAWARATGNAKMLARIS